MAEIRVHPALLILAVIYGVGKLLPCTFAYARKVKGSISPARNQGRRGCVCITIFFPNYRQFGDRLLPSNLKAHVRSRHFAHQGSEKQGLHNLSEKLH